MSQFIDPERAARTKRAKIYYAITTALVAGALATFFTLAKPLILPIVFGAIFAFMFKPLFKKNLFPILPKWVSATFMVALIFGSSTLLVRKIINSQPNEREKLELQVRARYKANQRYQQFFNIDFEKHTGNFLFNTFKKDLESGMEKVNRILEASPEQIVLIEKYYKGEFGADQKFSEKYYQYFQENQSHPIFGTKKGPEASGEAASREVSSVETESSASISQLMQLLTAWILFPLVFIFLLMDKGNILRSLIGIVPNRYFEMTLTTIGEVESAIGKYLRGTAIECALVGVSFSIGLVIIGVEFKAALVMGVIAGVTNVIPFLGTAIGMIVGVAYALIVEDINPWVPFVTLENLPVLIIALVGFVHLLDNAIFQPVVVGGAVHLHPLVVIVGVFAGSMMFGFIGMLFAIPTIVVVKTIGETLSSELKAYKII